MLGVTSIFADDVSGSWTFRSPADCKQALRAIGVLVQTLQKVGLELSTEKTVILMAATGASSSSVLAGFRTHVDKIPHLKVPVAAPRSPSKSSLRRSIWELRFRIRALNCST